MEITPVKINQGRAVSALFLMERNAFLKTLLKKKDRIFGIITSINKNRTWPENGYCITFEE
jgi:hypothetical protein